MPPSPPRNANDLTARLLVELPKQIKGLKCWRQSVGGAYPIQSIAPLKSAIARGDMAAAKEICSRIRPLHFGPPNGSADIGGLMPDGTALGVEVKYGRDRQSPEQIICQSVFDKVGAVYVIARDVDEAVAEVKGRVTHPNAKPTHPAGE